MSELQEQIHFFYHVRSMRDKDPRYCMVSSSQNGAFLGGRTPLQRAAQANKLKASGLEKGYPDITCLIPSDTHHGLFIELKIAPNKLTPEQKLWQERLNAWGYLAVTAWSANEAIGILAAYLSFARITPSEPVDVKQAVRVLSLVR